ncbi:MAG: 50S ribosomal protein L18 [Asgard group archaeon]|nr:50S ribosomal protein L18 [Asgard group archaeon]
MARSANYHVPFRRRREGKTNFHRRKRLLRSGKNRLVVRRSNKHQRVSIVYAKVIGDETLVDASSQHLKKYGWKGATSNVPASYLTGYLAGKYAKALGIKDAILDIGINTCSKDTRISALLCGAVHAGLTIPHDPEIFPSEDRYTGKIIADYATELKKKDAKKYDKQFSGYTKNSAKPESLPTYFKATIKAIDDELASGAMKNNLKSRNDKNKKSKSAPKKKPTAPMKPTTPAKSTTTTQKPKTADATTSKPKTTDTTTPKPKTTDTTPKSKTTTTTTKPTTTESKKSTTTTTTKTPQPKSTPTKTTSTTPKKPTAETKTTEKKPSSSTTKKATTTEKKPTTTEKKPSSSSSTSKSSTTTKKSTTGTKSKK